jgi:hypothetical protein
MDTISGFLWAILAYYRGRHVTKNTTFLRVKSAHFYALKETFFSKKNNFKSIYCQQLDFFCKKINFFNA